MLMYQPNELSYADLLKMPDCPGKRAALRILNTPKLDREKLRKEVKEFEKQLYAERMADFAKEGIS